MLSGKTFGKVTLKEIYNTLIKISLCGLLFYRPMISGLGSKGVKIYCHIVLVMPGIHSLYYQIIGESVDLTDEPIFLLDKDKVIRVWNRAVEKFTLLGKAEILGQREDYLCEVLYGDGRSTIAKHVLDFDDEALMARDIVKIAPNTYVSPLIIENTFGEKTAYSATIIKLYFRSQLTGVLEIIKNYQSDISVDLMLEVILKERREMSQDIHDELLSLLSTQKVFLDLLQNNLRSCNIPFKRDYLDYSLNLNVETLKTTRRLIGKYSVAEELTFLRSTLLKLCHWINKTRNIFIEVKIPREIDSISYNAQAELVKICKELINNTLAHSGATRAWFVFLYTQMDTTLIYKDNGGGFDKDTTMEGNGLKNIRRRLDGLNADWIIESSPHNGFMLKATLTN